jgi:putative transport protein
MRFNIRNESKKLEESMSLVDPAENLSSGYQDWSIRAVKVNAGAWHKKTVAEIENSNPDRRILVGRIRKQSGLIDPSPDLVIEEGDVLAISARTRPMLNALEHYGHECSDYELLDFPIVHVELVVTQKNIAGKTLAELAKDYGEGLMLNRLVRTGQIMPFEAATIVNAGDILHLSGRQPFVEKITKAVGFKEITTADTDMIFVGIGIVLGGFFGLLSLQVGGILITLSTSGGALLMGLVFGWLHSKTPAFGRIPEAALWVFDTVGLATFLAIVGLTAGPSFISGIKQTGFGIIPAGLVVAVLPHIIGFLAGKYLLKMNPIILLGAQCGAGTTTTALKAVQDAAGSRLPVLGYTIPYALGNILLTAWGPVIVSIMT